jgi:hypothetical protein
MNNNDIDIENQDNELDNDELLLAKIEDDDHDNICKKKCNAVFHWKRFFLPLAVALPILIYFEKLRMDIYIFFSCLISSLIICWNFPGIAKMGYTKPIYFEDLAEQTQVSRKILKKKILNNIETSKNFQYQFILIQQIILSFTIAIIIEYASYRYKSTNLIFTEVLGLLGGLVSLYSKITKIIGKILLKFLYYKKKRERKRIIRSMNSNSKYKVSFEKILNKNNMKKSISDTHLVLRVKNTEF